MSPNSAVSLVFAVLAFSLVSLAYGDDLYNEYYDNTCNNFEEIVAAKMKEWFHKDRTIAASIIRLHFHDCAVRGCDASILLDYQGSERTANASKTLRGFEVIDDIKSAIEAKCHAVVSCADILTAAARDATVLLKGPYWSNQYGRKDGYVSKAEEADMLPMGHEDLTTLIEFYQSLGLNLLELVVLSGAHTVGRTSCAAVHDRLYNYKGTGKPDPSMDPGYLNYLRRKCRNPKNYVDLDAKTPFKFDNKYYENLERNMGLLYTDQILHMDHRTNYMIDMLASHTDMFPYQFSSAMVKLGAIMGDAEDDGEVRLKCSCVNPYVA